MKKVILPIGILVSTLVSCSKGTVSSVTEKSIQSPIEYNETEAANLYTNRCGTCHKLQAREKYTAKQWERIVPDMAKKAKLNADQEAIILKYVLTSPKQ
jgi:nitrate/TMAO reductase-like tetraheme cytochrome c subunit